MNFRMPRDQEDRPGKMEGKEEEENEELLVIILAILSASLACLVIILCIKLFCCKRRSNTYSINNSSQNFAAEQNEGQTASPLPRGGSQVWMEDCFDNEYLGAQYDSVPMGTPMIGNGNPRIICLGDNPAFRSLEVEEGDLRPNQLVAMKDGAASDGAASLHEINEEEHDATAALDQGQANHAFVPSADEEILMDSELQELMVPDMKESKLVEVRSKLLVFISKRIDSNGGQLVLDKMGISLFIPPCAIERGKPQTVFLALNWDLKDFPEMSASQTIVAPVVHVGPHGLQLKRPATLSFRHCAFDTSQVKVYSSETHLMENKSWSLSEATIQKGKDKTHTILDTECQVHISHFTLYTCIAEGNESKKWLQLVAFGGRMRVHRHYEVRVYLLNNTPCALQFAIENEKKHGFKAIKCPQEFLFDGNGADMSLQVDRVNEGWSANLSELKETVPYLNIWHGKCPFVSFIFKHEKRATKDICTTISAFQKSHSDYKLKLKLVAKMPRRSKRQRSHKSESSQSERESDSCTNSEGSPASSLQSSGFGPSPTRDDCNFNPGEPQMESFSDDSRSSYSSCSCSPEGHHKDRRRECSKLIPHKLRMSLVHLLEPSDTLGNDWRMIASDLGMDTKIPMLKEKDSPFQEVLKVMEEQNKDLNWLVTKLISHQRLDAAGIVTTYLQTGEIHS